MAFVSGTAQSGEVGKELAQPLVVEVHDANGAPVSGRSVTFTASAGGGYFVADVTALTDAQGRAQTRWVLGPGERNEITADAEGAKATTTATATNPWQLDIFAGQPAGRMFRDGNAEEARFGEPSAIAVGADGKVYIGDVLAHSLRLYDPGTKQVTTLAGLNGEAAARNGIGSAARLLSPHGLTFDGNGRLLVAATYAHKVARVDLATNDVTFFAGTGVAGGNPSSTDVANANFHSPFALDWDAARNVVYVVENGNHDVREINLTTSQVTTLAGKVGEGGYADDVGAAARFNYPMGITHAGKKVYVSDRGNCRIRVIDIDSQAVSTLTGGGGGGCGYVDGVDGPTSGLVAPASITHANGALYLADRGAHAIRKIDVTTGAVRTIAGSAPSASAPAPKMGAKDGPGASALFFHPQGIAPTPDGKALYVGESGGTDVRRVELNDTFDVQTVAAKAVVPTDGAAGEAILSRPRGLAIVGGKLVIAENQGNAIRTLDLATGRVQRIAGPVDEEFGISDKPGSDARFAFPTAMVANAAEGVVYLTGGDQTIRQVKIDTGTPSKLAGGDWARSFADGVGDQARFTDPGGFAFDAKAQKVYIADSGNHRIRVLDLASRAVTTLAGSVAGHRDGAAGDARFSLPRGLALKDNVLYVSDQGNHLIRRIELDGKGSGTVSTFAGMVNQAGTVDGRAAEAQFKAPWSLGLDGDLLYVADVYSNALRRIHIPTATVSTLVGGVGVMGPGSVTMPNKPVFLLVRPGGEVLFTTAAENVVFRLGPRRP